MQVLSLYAQSFFDKHSRAAEAAGIPLHRVLFLDEPEPLSCELPYPLLRDLISEFKDTHVDFTRRTLAQCRWGYIIKTCLLRYLARPFGHAKGIILAVASFDTTTEILMALKKILSLSYYSIIANIDIAQKSTRFNPLLPGISF